MYKILSSKKILFLGFLVVFIIFLVSISSSVKASDCFTGGADQCFYHSDCNNHCSYVASSYCSSNHAYFDNCWCIEWAACFCTCDWDCVDCCGDLDCTSSICNNYSCCSPVYTISCSVNGDDIEVCWNITDYCGRTTYVERYSPSQKTLYAASSPISKCEWDNNLSAGTYGYRIVTGSIFNAAYTECTISACDCTDWTPGDCGGGTCESFERQYTRTCDPSGCDIESKCESDPSCTKPDFDVISFTGPSTVEVDETFTYNSTVENIGDGQPAQDSTIIYYADGTGVCGYGLWREYMTPGGTEDTSCSSLKFSSAGNHTVKVCADPDNNIPESNEGNNCETRTVTVECASQDSKKCYDHDVYWYDSCGNREDREEDCGSSGWSDNYRCKDDDRWKQREWIKRDCSESGGAHCYEDPEWKNDEDCGTTTYGDWSYYCHEGDEWKKRPIYYRGCSESGGAHCYYDDSSTQNEFVKDCGEPTCGPWSSWYCDGQVKTRERTCSGGCNTDTGKCTTGSWPDYDKEDCGSDHWADPAEYRCSGDIRQRKMIRQGCSEEGGAHCYSYPEWIDVNDCGSDHWADPPQYQCSSGWIMHLYIYQGCSEDTNDCYTTPNWQGETYCGDSDWADPAEYQCSGSWKQKKWINRGCSESGEVHCYATPEWKNDQNCAETCFPGVLAEGCEGGTYSCVDGECTYPISQCIPRQFTSSGIACECNEGRKTILKACDGAGACLDVEEVCDVQCGADPGCQGLKPGDAYPGKPGRICCEGKWGLPKWREIVPW